MASTNDPRAGGFDADAFRSAIEFAMNMGMPEAPAEKATFQWRTIKDFPIADITERPFDWTATPTTSTAHADVTVPVAVEFSSNVSGTTLGTSQGSFENPYAVITMLDTYHSQIVGASTVLLGGNTYVIRYTEPPIGLFEVTVYRLHLQAMDES